MYLQKEIDAMFLLFSEIDGPENASGCWKEKDFFWLMEKCTSAAR
jgi:hypothetical protein